MGVDLCVKVVNIPDSDTSVELYMYDTGGADLFADLRSHYWKNASMVVLVYDVTNANSFNNCSIWLQACAEAFPEQKIRGVVVANKMDMSENAQVTVEQGRDMAAEHQLQHFECSALDGRDVDAPFFFIANEFYRMYEEKLKVLESE
eukprot:TRINITY_DN6651_c0_g2_i2.p1 TRINITY_DN6651_c0_g2~~TRINITY_DN6651_c0_g2_i2.p1  ORF type:complete len:147 (+),score=37.50 TRINITY_DN6651_c0_g2_i2:249-689(+)